MASLKNLKHEAFCRELIEGTKNGWNAAEAYRRVYGTEGHVSESAASRLLKNVEVQTRLAELSEPAARKTRVTVESLLAELGATVQAAREAKQFGAVNGALTLVGKLTGLLRDRLEVGSVGEFDGCKSNAEVIDKMIQDEGSARAVLDQLDHMRALVEERAASAALDVSPAQEWPTMAERRGRLRA